MNARFLDPIVEEVRTIRKGVIQECAEKHEDYYTHLIALQERYRERTVSCPAKISSEQQIRN